MKRFTYSVEISRREIGDSYVRGLYLAECRDIWEAVAIGATVHEALTEAARELEFAIAKRIVYGHQIPTPSPTPKSAKYTATVPDSLARLASKYLKAAKGRHLKVKSFLWSQRCERVSYLMAQRTGTPQA